MPIITVQKLNDADRDADSLDDFVSGNGKKEVTTRRGKKYKTAPEVEQTLLDNGLQRGFENLAKLQAHRPAVEGSLAKDMSTRKIWRWDGSKWHDTGKSDLDLAIENTELKFNAIDSYRVNSGKNYPFLRKIRAGVNRNPNKVSISAVLDIKIYGADPDFYYRLEIIENGNVDFGGDGNGIKIAKYPISTYETVGAGAVIHNNSSKNGLSIDYVSKGIQKQTLKCDDDDIIFEITIDVDQLPPFGELIASTNSNAGGYNWIIDPICYFANTDFEKVFTLNKLGLAGVGETSNRYLIDYDANHLKINTEKNYPMQLAMRSDSAPVLFHPRFRDALLDVRVLGARKGYVYQPATIQNGADFTEFGATKNYGVTIVRIPIDRLSSGFSQNIVIYTDESVQLKPDREKGGVQTFYVECPDDPVTTIKLVIDVDMLPPDGVAMQQSRDNQRGFNTIIDPVCYEYLDEFEFNGGDLLVEYLPENVELGFKSFLSVAYISGKKWYQTYISKRSINETFAPLGYGFADAYTQWGDLIPVEKAKFKLRSTGRSDFHGPVVLYALNNADTVVRQEKLDTSMVGKVVSIYDNDKLVGTSVVNAHGGWFFKTTGLWGLGYKLQAVIENQEFEVVVREPLEIYTSGSHGTDTQDKGDPTATQKELTILVDDFILDLSKPFKKIARSVECIGTIHAMAGNTAPSGRYVLEQNYTYRISQHGLWIDCVYNALEDVNMITDGCCQHYWVGNTPLRTNTIMFWGGGKPREQLKEEKWDTGPKSQYPNIFGLTTIHPQAGEYTSWVDCTYGVGDREFLADDQPLYSHPRPTSKIYPKVLRNMKVMKGASYKWRGGYYFGENQATTEYDNKRKTQAGWVLIKHDSSYTII